MNSWLIVPRDPLIFRDGKPFTATPGERAKSIGFPFPSTIAGAVRTRSGTDPQTGSFNKDKIPDLLSRPVHGPVLVEVGHDDKLTSYFPAPADARWWQRMVGHISTDMHSNLSGRPGALSLISLRMTRL